ncbi:hypothetical protein ABLE68_10375 [Nocardioides sp. CN2-186]|uniref:hypothetical protein n=1 Tax=Nocardioides tweenelious TaxID=3156607 RepID=UPI0032B4BDC9
MDTDLRDELDRSFGDGPAIDDTAVLLDRGHRALRRRRLASGAATLAVAVVAISTSAVLHSGPSESTGVPLGPPASSPSQTPQDTEVDGVVLVPDPSMRRSTPVVLARDGSVHVWPDAQVTVAIPNPFERVAPSTSAAVIYLVDGKPHWYVGYYEPDQGGGGVMTPARDDVSFRDWVLEQKAVQGSDRGTGGGTSSAEWPGRVDLELVRFAGQSARLEAQDGVTLLQQRPHPQVGDSFAAADDLSAVAEVRYEGERYYVLARHLPGDAPQYIAVSAAEGGSTLADFLDYARGRYAEGGGGLL